MSKNYIVFDSMMVPPQKNIFLLLYCIIFDNKFLLILRNSKLLSINFLCVTLSHMSIRARIVIAVALHQIDYAPDTKPGSKCYNKGLQNVYCAIEKCHKYILSAASAAVRQADKRRSAYAAAQKNRPLVKAAVPALRKSCGAAVFSCKGCGFCRCVLRRKVGARIM